MNKTYKVIALSTLMLAGFAGSVQAYVSLGFGFGGGYRKAADSAGQTFWRIQNRSGHVMEISSDTSTLRLPPGSDGRLSRGGSYIMTIDGREFRSTDHVIVFYTTDSGDLGIETFGAWRSRVGFGFGTYGLGWGPAWGYRRPYYGGGIGFGFGVGGGYRGGYRGGWYGGHRHR
jgi:hypothetical protein